MRPEQVATRYVVKNSVRHSVDGSELSLAIGAEPSGCRAPDGGIDDVRVHSVALTPAQIAALADLAARGTR